MTFKAGVLVIVYCAVESICMRCANKNNHLEKRLYISNGSMKLSQTFEFFTSSHTPCPPNFIKTTNMVY